MKQFPILPACLLVFGAGVLIPLFAKAPDGLKKSPVPDLVIEANEQIEDLETWTKSAAEYKTRQDDIRRAAGVLAVLGQAIMEHPEGKTQKLSPMGLRDAALNLAASTSHQGAMNSIRNIRAAQKGIPNMKETPPAAWKDLISMDDLMHVVNSRNSRVIRAARRSRDPEGDARHAQTIAILTLVMAEQAEDYLSEEAEIKAWKTYAMDFHAGMTDLATAFKAKDKAKDKAGIRKHLAIATKACNACHAQFRDTE